jgi:predicted alpha/beta hydrolase
MTEPAPPRPTTWTTPTSDGWSLSLRTSQPAGTPKASILLSPGMMLDGRAMDRPPGAGLASFFRNRGYLVTTLDLRGHGSSRPRASRKVDWNFDDLVLQDIPAAVGAVRQRHPTLPLAWLGHSLSAHAGVVAAGLHTDLGLDALVALCPGPWLRVLEPSRMVWWGKRLLLLAWSALTVPFGRFPAHALGMGTNDESRGFVGQHVQWGRDPGWHSSDGAIDYLAALRRVAVPSLVVSAEGDVLCRPAQVERFSQLVGNDATPGVYWHVGRQRLGSSHEPGHMGVLTAPPALRLWEEMELWIETAIRRESPIAPRSAPSRPDPL